MGFVLLVLVLMWLVIWPIIMYYHFKPHAPTTPPTRQVANADNFGVDTTLLGSTARVLLDIGGTAYVLETSEAEKLARRVDRVRMRALSMNELMALEGK